MIRVSMILLVVAIFLDRVSARIIDDFSVGPVSIQQTSNASVNSDQQDLDPIHVLGGVRYIQTGFGGGGATQTATVDTTAQKFTLTTSGSTLGYVQLRYGSLAQPLDLDLTGDGSQFFLFSFTDILPSTFSPPFNIQINGAGVQRTVQLRPQSSSTRDIVNMLVPYSSFSPTLVDVDSISISATRYPQNSQFSLLRIATVIPEPSTVMLAGISAVFLLKRRIRSS